MEVTRILAEIDAQIAKLQQARALLSGEAPSRRGPGRPKGSAAGVAAPAVKQAGKKRGRRALSAEARKRIADAQKKRWAEQRKQK